MKLLGSAENEITKDKIGENVPYFEITEVVIVHFNIVNNDYQQDSRVLFTFVRNKPSGSLFQTNVWYSIRNFTEKSYLFRNV